MKNTGPMVLTANWAQLPLPSSRSRIWEKEKLTASVHSSGVEAVTSLLGVAPAPVHAPALLLSTPRLKSHLTLT